MEAWVCAVWAVSGMVFFGLRWRLLSFLNVLFFGVALVTDVLAGLFFTATTVSGSKVAVFPGLATGNAFLLFLFIFFFNLAVSSFVVVTLPGFLFFPLSIVSLGYRAVLWGLLFYPLSSMAFLSLLPVVALEGEAYVLAASAGALTGLSWVRPEKGQGRAAAFMQALKQCAHIYLLVAALLLTSAAIETALILL